MRTLLPLALAAVLAACSTSPVVTPDDHPASPTASAAVDRVEFTTLELAPQPDLPAVLRPDGHAPAGSQAGLDPHAGGHNTSAMGHDAATHNAGATMEADEAAMSHTALDHMAGRYGDDNDDAPDAAPMAASVTAGLSEALDAYLAIQTSLASDELDGVAAQARAFDAAVAEFDASPVEGDPHFWHARAADLGAIRAGAKNLAAASDLAAARRAFGALSAPFVGLVEATGVPEGYDVARFSCGMVDDAPEGGVWLQRGDATRNPYYGDAMRTCGAEDRPIPMMEHEGMDHSDMEGIEHSEMDHSNVNHDGRP